MRQKELRIALICYGGISLAVYMHGVTKEIWKLTRASRSFHSGVGELTPGERIYRRLLERVESEQQIRLRVLPDILTGASAGGINAVFLAQAVHSGQSLDPLTDLWLKNADVDRLLDPEAQLWTWVAKFWAPPVVRYLLSRPNSVVQESVAPEMRREVRKKLARFVRSRWFQPPFSGIGFSGLLADALAAMEQAPAGDPLLPAGHPMDLFVTATDFHGYLQALQLHSPPLVEESEHRLPIGFRARVPAQSGISLANPLELTLAARSTASFPGAFPPLKLEEIDQLADLRGLAWDNRAQFLQRVMPVHVRDQELGGVSLVDGSVLVNAPFSEALDALKDRPAQREVDRRFVYIDPTPDRRMRTGARRTDVGFFKAILGSVSSIPREQPIRDNLEVIQNMSREATRMAHILAALRPDVERAVDRLFGRTFFLDRPTTKRLANWREKAQQAAAEQAGYSFHSYAQAKFSGILDRLARLIVKYGNGPQLSDHPTIARRLRAHLEANGLASLANPKGGASDEAIAFLRAHDLGFRIRRLRLLTRRLSRDWEDDAEITDADRDKAREMLFRVLSLYFERDGEEALGPGFAELTESVLTDPGAVLDHLAEKRDLAGVDIKAEEILAEGLEEMCQPLRRKMLLAYLGFPFYDVATLPLMRNEGLTEFDPIKVDRISPDDASAIRGGGAEACLRGIEFYNFGAFFSRAYRENDYLWGRLHGAERMVDLICSTLPEPMPDSECRAMKQELFLAILDEEKERLRADPSLISGIRAEVKAMTP
ncbi:patatin-like protein [Alteraurantiacibacter aquimixticola]|uniref:Patatin-like protein n=1 Tax=Alteraurantiacibacter aquimixticola TaxID=2489173 RepID=A0A4T3F1C7_9SPHN|nr:patatin-like protein [Alteraurantiacibacter aquimixticola]TIX50075.1 patatin-like protein [Alteraurantiacibacter aquimixticola]